MLNFLAEQLELAEQLNAGRETMFEPQDLPGRYGRVVQALDHVLLPLIELKLAAGRAQDHADVIKLIQANPEQIDKIRGHFVGVHAVYVADFDRLVQQAHQEAEGGV